MSKPKKESPSGWRFSWKRAVCRSTDLPPRAKVLAGALAESGNDETGLINPSLDTLADSCGMCKDTIRSAVKDLTNAGWLLQTKGHGKGNSSVYVLIYPGNVVAFAPKAAPAKPAEKVEPHRQKRSKRIDLSGGQTDNGKGRNPAPKRSNCFVPIQKHEQQEQHRARASDRPRPDLSCRVERDSDAAQDWAEWLARHGHPPLEALTRLHRGGAYFLPYRRPPRDCDEVQARITADVIAWAKGARDADAA